MQRCLELAKLGGGKVSPNPMVGAVLVCKDRIIGEGYHEYFGGPHAEVNCINSVPSEDQHLISDSTLYVSLEPCVHFGKTPPCTDLILNNKISKVVIGCGDSYAEVNGKGIEKLRANAVDVTVGFLEKECLDLNKRFFTFHREKRPYVVLKWAQSVDGKIGKLNERTMISNECTNRLVHRWRTEENAIMVGTNTALTDDPALTTRLWPGRDPIRIVLDKELRLPSYLHLFDGKVKTVVFNFQKDEEKENLLLVKIDKQKELLSQIVSKLHSMEIQSVIIEGGARLLQTFISSGYWDEARVIINEQLSIGEGVNAPILQNDRLINREVYGTDTINYYRRKIEQ